MLESNKDISDIPHTPFVKKLYEGQFRSVAQSCLTLCGPMDCSTPGVPVHHQLPELAQTHGHQVSKKQGKSLIWAEKDDRMKACECGRERKKAFLVDFMASVKSWRDSVE